ncbi:MAG: T9SS type A sorting domain-containing protein [Bacteroidota bacterium]
MKKLLLSALLTVSFVFSIGQINSENTYSYSGTYAKLSVSGNKFYLMDVLLSQTRIYNTNHTIWKTINLPVPSGNYLYDIKHLSEGLFTSDNSLCLAYVYYIYDETNAYYTFNARIIKENGTELLSIPGCQYIEIMDMGSDGVKLVAYCYDYSLNPYTVQTRIYSLPGTLMPAENPSLPVKTGLPFPNPAISHTTIPYRLPAGIQTGSVKVVDMQGRVVGQQIIKRNAGSITLPTDGYYPGLYNYSIESGNQRFETGRFIVK